MSLKQTIMEDIKSAMKAKDKEMLSTLRMLSAALKQVEVDERKELGDADITSIIGKMIKQRKDSITQFEQAGRNDLKEKEEFEVGVLQNYLPEQLSTDEVENILKQVIADVGASGMQDMGKVMAQAKQKIAGRADMGQASQLVKALLQATA